MNIRIVGTADLVDGCKAVLARIGIEIIQRVGDEGYAATAAMLRLGDNPDFDDERRA